MNKTLKQQQHQSGLCRGLISFFFASQLGEAPQPPWCGVHTRARRHSHTQASPLCDVCRGMPMLAALLRSPPVCLLFLSPHPKLPFPDPVKGIKPTLALEQHCGRTPTPSPLSLSHTHYFLLFWNIPSLFQRNCSSLHQP